MPGTFFCRKTWLSNVAKVPSPLSSDGVLPLFRVGGTSAGLLIPGNLRHLLPVSFPRATICSFGLCLLPAFKLAFLHANIGSSSHCHSAAVVSGDHYLRTKEEHFQGFYLDLFEISKRNRRIHSGSKDSQLVFLGSEVRHGNCQISDCLPHVGRLSLLQ